MTDTAAAKAFVDDIRFNQTFELPPSTVNGLTRPLKVAYADYGYRNEAHPEEETVLLWFPPMLATRLSGISRDAAAKKRKIRIVAIDRPNVGRTDAVPNTVRIETVREIHIALLARLQIPHVALATHSAGAVYALDLVLHHPEVLHPGDGFLALGTPWILPKYTTSTAMAVVSRLPNAVLSRTHNMGNFITKVVGPAIGVSSGCISRLIPGEVSAPKVSEDDGLDAKWQSEVSSVVIRRVYDEGAAGVSDEAILLMQHHNKGAGWADWGDHDTLVPRLVDKLRSRNQKLRIDVFYAESDIMIGPPSSKGPLWFDEIWAPNKSQAIDYRRTTVAGADHDGLWDVKFDATRRLLDSVGRVATAQVTAFSTT